MLPFFATQYDHNTPSVAFLFYNQVLIVTNIFYINEPKTKNKDDGYS
jgi:hypothetical protein